MGGPAIRVAGWHDEGALLALHRDLHVRHRDAVVPPGQRELHAFRGFEDLLAQDLRAMLDAPAVHLLVAEEGGRIIGYATGKRVVERHRARSPKGVVGDWYVVPEARGRGVGRALLRALIERFRAEGCRMVESSTLPGNLKGRRLHELLGFHEVEVRYRKPL
ncbi:MAG: N-acetyltransferase family protein [Myxococcota bacterium]